MHFSRAAPSICMHTGRHSSVHRLPSPEPERATATTIPKIKICQAIMGTEEIRKDMDISSWCAELAYDQWIPLPVNGKPPSARYKHATALIDDKFYLVGGSRNGRYLSDVQVFDFKSLSWSSMTLSFEPNAGGSKENRIATSGHVLIEWENKLLIIGGHSKSSSDSIQLRYINLDTHACGFLETSGDIPVARGGHSATLIGSRLIVFGGEDGKRRLLNDIHILDLVTLSWESVETMQVPPAPRFDHTSAVHGERYLLVFGGCSHSVFYNDLHVLDLQTKEWSQPETQGDQITARAGHAGVSVGENWYIVGGGDNKSGCSETLMFNMSKLVWSTTSNVREREPLRSEGLTLCTILIAGETYLVAFGGYNGKYQNEIFVMRPKPTESATPKIFQSPAAAAAAASVTAAYALTKPEKVESTESVDSRKLAANKVSQRDAEAELSAIKEEKNALELSLAEVREENSKQREKISEANSTLSELSKARP
ncbi:hypothetical protein SAY86_025245 [Trapa natans]|uniref:Acyl-CoA-binding domain-containing protein 4 n=1 Tax=Trapa natans TaxID=22666 RepID=A0AAN7REX0_TRANT|nr:hypothetical protein SAY86_025245 [Trapa natans]